MPAKDEFTNDMARTIQDWAKMEWYEFGLDLGKLLQKIVVTEFAQKYRVDGNGQLHTLWGLSSSAQSASGSSILRHPFGLLVSVAFLVTVLALLALRALKVRRLANRSISPERSHLQVAAKLEAGECIE